MALEVYLNFPGNCRQALDFYSQVFGAEKTSVMTWGDMPGQAQNQIAEDTKKLIMHATLPVLGSNLMMADIPPNMEFIAGNNITLTIGLESKEEITSLFSKLKESGIIVMDLQETFFSPWYGQLVDKFGIPWQFVYAQPM